MLSAALKKKSQKLFEGAKKVRMTFNSENRVLNLVVNMRRNKYRHSETYKKNLIDPKSKRHSAKVKFL